MNKNKLIPELRFPEFIEHKEWCKKTIADIANSESSSMALNKLELKQTGYPVYGADSVIGYINEYQQEEAYISIVKDGSGVGRLNLCESKSSILGTLTCIKTKNESEYNLVWIYYLLNTIDFSIYIKGSGIPHIYYSDYKNENIAVPQIKEQLKISSCLSSLDELISAHRQKLDALKEHKKGLLQNLFPQEGETVHKYRFPEFVNDGAWVEKKLGDKEISSFANQKTSIRQLKLDTYISTENMLPDFSGIQIIRKLPSTGSFTKFIKGDILISNIRPYLKKVWKADIDGAASNDVLVFRAGKEVISEFLEYIIKNDAFINYIMKSAKGVKMPRGDKNAMQEYSIFVPLKKEQQKIATCLLSLDDIITSQTKKIEQLKLHRKGLMQGLFLKNDN